VFSRISFHEAKISEIATEAGVAYGSFYTYFDSKEDVFWEVLQCVHAEAFAFSAGRDLPVNTGAVERIAVNNLHYYEAYRDNARILASFEQVADSNERFARLRAKLRGAYIDRAEAAIRRWQREGLVDASLDAKGIAHALGSMVERLTYMQSVFGEGPGSETRAVDAMNRVWAATLGLESPPLAGAASDRKRRGPAS